MTAKPFTTTDATRLLARTAQRHGIDVDEMTAPGRAPAHVVAAKRELVRALRDDHGWTWARIGEVLDTDHSSAHYLYHSRGR